MRGSRKLIWIAAAVAVVTLVLACGVIAFLPRRAPVAIATRQEVEQRAVQFAQDLYNGTVTTVAVRATTQGEVNPQRCSFTERVAQQFTAMMNADQQLWCDDNLPMWHVTMQGEFRSHSPDGGAIRTLQMTMMPDGNVTTVGEGPVVEER